MIVICLKQAHVEEPICATKQTNKKNDNVIKLINEAFIMSIIVHCCLYYELSGLCQYGLFLFCVYVLSVCFWHCSVLWEDLGIFGGGGFNCLDSPEEEEMLLIVNFQDK